MRVAAIALGVAAAILATRTTITSLDWVGRVFPGFLVLDNGVIPSITLPAWSGNLIPGLYQSAVVSMDGVPVASARDVYERASRTNPGTPIRYRLEQHGAQREVTIATQRFGDRDWVFLFGAYLLNSVVCLVAGLVVWVLRPAAPLARALLAFGGACSLYLLTAMDLYGPATFFRLYAVAETLVPAAGLQLALLFPQPHAFARWRFVGYGVSFAILLPYQWLIYSPAAFSAFVLLDAVYLGLVAAFAGARLVSEYRRGDSALARQRVRVITLGTLFGLTLPGAILGMSAFFGGGIAMNAAGTTPCLFMLFLAYAVVKHDLFEIEAMVKRGAYYLLLTGAVGVAYLGAITIFNWILRAGEFTGSLAFPVIFTLAVLLLFNPLRTRLQALVDRVFFRTHYDAAQVLAAAGAALASALQREQIVGLVCDTVQAAIPNGRTRLFVETSNLGLSEGDAHVTLPVALATRLAEGRVVTIFDPLEEYPNPEIHEDVRRALLAFEAEIAVPLLRTDELTGVLTAGPKRSGLFYTAGDAEFLRALGHQAAIALENARSYEALAALNARLEERVRERTAQLEAMNQELADAYSELKTAEVQLVQSEKMASLGRLVAGVAHEINNPVSFIASNVAPLRRRLAEAALAVPPDAQKLLREAQEIADIMARGAERTARIVKDLRTFSRLGEATRKAADLQDGIEVSLRLLDSRWRDRITIHRDYGTLPLVEGDPGQLNQVFMNVLANACDAIPGTGNVWITTRADGDDVTVTIRDDGPGMTAEIRSRIFEPFFTTKDVGRGTGLGLAISHSVVMAHGGRIEVESVPGAGATFRIALPVAAGRLAEAAGGG